MKASVVFPTRNALTSGSFLSFAMYSFFPAMIPACAPPNNLSPLKLTISTPSSKGLPYIRFIRKTFIEVFRSNPEPISYITGIFFFLPKATKS